MSADASPNGEASVALVSEIDLERELAALRAAAGNNAAGLFGPGSATWRVDREAGVFLAAGRALLLQLAHPWVAAAIAEHSNTLADPIGRFHRTFATVFTMVFGGTEQALAAARRLHRRHAAIAGVLAEDAGRFPSGSPYRANELAALRWVFATLIDSALVAFALVSPPLSAAEQERYYAESFRFAALFGIPRAALPGERRAFSDYFSEMLDSDSLVPGDAARRIATGLFAGAATGVAIPTWYRALTVSLLPDRLRVEFGLRYGPAERRVAERAASRLRRIYPCIPKQLRYVAPYHEARARIAGRSRPGSFTRRMNRLWIGRDSLAG